jgi:hypothetical protein
VLFPIQYLVISTLSTPNSYILAAGGFRMSGMADGGFTGSYLLVLATLYTCSQYPLFRSNSHNARSEPSVHLIPLLVHEVR